MKKVALIVFAVLGTLVVLGYAADYAIFRLRIARNSAYGRVLVRQYYAIQEKNNRTEYVFGSTQEQTCVNALFGHQGLHPCWYLRRHPEQQVTI
jgi:hypothetical protein